MYIPASMVVKLIGEENGPAPELLTEATLHSYVLYSSRPVTVTEVPVVLALTVESPNCSSLSSMLYWIMISGLSIVGGVQDTVTVVAVKPSIVTFCGADTKRDMHDNSIFNNDQSHSYL